MKNKRLLLIVEPSKVAFDRTFEVMKTRSNKYKGMLIISFPDFETLGRVITPSRLELLFAIRKHKPKSVQELAKIMRRAIKIVTQDVKTLAEFGLIELKAVGPRKVSTPTANFSELVLAA